MPPTLIFEELIICEQPNTFHLVENWVMTSIDFIPEVGDKLRYIDQAQSIAEWEQTIVKEIAQSQFISSMGRNLR